MSRTRQQFAIVNFGDDSVALMQWLIENNQQSFTTLLLVNTHFFASGWQARIDSAISYAKQNGLEVVTLEARFGFEDLVKDRGEFPSNKFQWCAGLLKGSPINEYLDEHDPFSRALLLLSKRQAASRFNQLLSKTIEESEHFGEREVTHPLWELSLEERNVLIKKTPLDQLNHRSLECEPCIHSTNKEVEELFISDKTRLRALETTIGQTMVFSQDKSKNQRVQERFDMGCGSYFGCGE